MKRIVFVLSLALCAAMSATSQEVVEFSQPIQGYLYDSAWGKIKTHYGFTAFAGPASGGEYAKRFLVDDSITVYGIAAGVVDLMTVFPHYPYDTSYTNSIENLRLYSSQADTLCPLAQVPVHLRTTPISYISHLEGPSIYSYSRKYAPMYELYFDNAVTVRDSFYVGMTFFIERPYTAPDGTEWEYACPPLALNYVAVDPSENVNEWRIICFHHRDDDGTFYKVWKHGEKKQHYTLLFPLLLPEGGDTTVVGTDTVAMGDTLVVTDTVIIGGDTIVTHDTLLAVVQNDLLQRLTGVTPNPAVGTAKVVASTGLTRVEAYNMAGAKVYDRPATGLSATLDVSHWPSGTYLLRIHTPLGTVTKKLIVK